ncbi:MAG: hypothetical protein KKC05_03910, partial [Nanoarchaeota archaeon]|nr:hypothetical protein [Nanoarchaeota archaeon]
MKKASMDFLSSKAFGLLVLLVAIVVLIATTASVASPISGILDMFGLLEKPDYDTIAEKESTDSAENLVCAINSVGSGEIDDTCAKRKDSLGLQVTMLDDTETICRDTAEDYKCCVSINFDHDYQWVSDSQECQSLGGTIFPEGQLAIPCVGPQAGRKCCDISSMGEEARWLKECNYPYDNERAESYCTDTRPSSIECTVNNFELVRDVTDVEEWIPWYGDPEYLMYWQKFPVEEDTWTYTVSWKTYAFIAVITVLPPLKAGKIVSLSLIKTAGKEMLEKLFKTTTVKKIVLDSVSEKVLRKSLRKTISNSAKTKFIQEDVKDYALERLSKADVKAAMSRAEQQMQASGVWDNTLATQSPDVAKEYAERSIDEALKGADIDRVISSTEVKNTISEKAARAAHLESLQYMGKEGLKEQFTDFIKQRIATAGGWAKMSAKFGGATLAAHAAAIADSMTQARYEYSPSKIVLKKALGKPKEFDLAPELTGKPVVLTVPNYDDLGVLPQLFDAEKLFHMVSPCYLKYLTVKNAYAECSVYSRSKML